MRMTESRAKRKRDGDVDNVIVDDADDVDIMNDVLIHIAIEDFSGNINNESTIEDDCDNIETVQNMSSLVEAVAAASSSFPVAIGDVGFTFEKHFKGHGVYTGMVVQIRHGAGEYFRSILL